MRIRSVLNQLTGPSRTIAVWLTSNDVKDADLTTGVIGRRCNTTRATVVRFCQRLGYQGFPEFKTAWMQEMLLAQQETKTERVCFGNDTLHVIDASLNSIQEVAATLDPDKYEQAVTMLSQATLTVWAGVSGGSAIVAAYGQLKMTRIGKKANMVSDIEGLRDMREITTPGDVVVVTSHSGQWPWVSEQMRAFRDKGCSVILVTGHPRSLMAREADIVLVAPSRHVNTGRRHVAIRVAQFMVVDMLTIEVAARIKGRALEWVDGL